MQIKLTGEYQIDRDNLINEYLLLWKSIDRWNEINEYEQINHIAIHAYLYEDCLNYQRFCREFSNMYKIPYSSISLGIISKAQKIQGVYIPFQEKLIEL